VEKRQHGERGEHGYGNLPLGIGSNGELNMGRLAYRLGTAIGEDVRKT